MITINDDHGLIRIETWEEALELPGFQKDIDPKSVKLVSIHGYYVFHEKVRCGPSTCHTGHNYGYVVKVAGGRLTNIGKDCGTTHFGVDFKNMRRNFDREIAEKENREVLESFRARIPDYLEYIELMRNDDRGADWIYKSIHCLTTPKHGVPPGVIDKLRGMKQSRQPEILAPRYATKEEIKQIEASEKRKIEGQHYINESHGRLNGFSVLYPENDLRELLVVDLEQGLRKILDLDVDSLSSSELKSHVNWSTTVDAKLKRADDAIRAGSRFLQRDNLIKLDLGAPLSSDDFQEFETFLDSLTTSS